MRPKRRPQGRSAPPAPLPAVPPQANPQLAAAVMAIIDKQLRDGTPPETEQTFDRLVAAGYTLEGARQLIAHVVIREVFPVMARGEVYDNARFVSALARLPQLPDEDDA